MSLSILVTLGRTLARAEKLTTAKVNAIAKGLNFSLTGTVGHGDIGAGAIQPDLVTPGAYSYAAATLSGGTYSATFSPAVASYTDGLWLTFKPDAANSGAVNLDAGPGAKPLRKFVGQALAIDDIKAGALVTVRYNTTLVGGGCFEVMGLLGLPISEDYHYGVGSYSAGVYAATVTPALVAYRAGTRIWFKADTANTGAADLNVNGLGAKNIFKRNATSELAANDILAGQIVEVIYDGTQFQMIDVKSPDYASAATSLPGSASVATFAHGLGAKPTRVRGVLMNNTAAAEQGYSQNDEIELSAVQNGGGTARAFAVSADATNVYVAQINNANVEVMPRTGGAFAAITEANWAIKVYASL